MEPHKLHGKPYRPSNGSEGDYFINEFCHNCIHGKYEHTGDINDNPCDIISNSMAFDKDDPNYPKQWTHDENGYPTCTAWVKWDWNRDDDGNLIDPPPPPEPENPNQLVLPFEFNEILKDFTPANKEHEKTT